MTAFSHTIRAGKVARSYVKHMRLRRFARIRHAQQLMAFCDAEAVAASSSDSAVVAELAKINTAGRNVSADELKAYVKANGSLPI